MHVFANLVQVPVLVLSEERTILPPISPAEFKVRIGTGKTFAPANVRVEGVDPISLAIVIDVTGDQADLMPALPAAIGTLAKSLLPYDRVSIYAVNCHLIQTAQAVIPDSADLQRESNTAITSPLTQDAAAPHGCGHGLYLWNALSHVISDLASQSGRRVVLAITDGLDSGSSLTAAQIRDRADTAGVAIFGLSALGNDVREGLYRESGLMPVFQPLCQSTGGIRFDTDRNVMLATMQNFLAIVRARYIVEFPRPAGLSKGHQGIQVTLKRTHAFIRSSGVSVLIADPVVPPSAQDLSPSSTTAAPQPDDPVPMPQ